MIKKFSEYAIIFIAVWGFIIGGITFSWNYFAKPEIYKQLKPLNQKIEIQQFIITQSISTTNY